MDTINIMQVRIMIIKSWETSIDAGRQPMRLMIGPDVAGAMGVPPEQATGWMSGKAWTRMPSMGVAVITAKNFHDQDG